MLRILIVVLVLLVAAMFVLPRGQRGAAPQNATELPQPTPLADVRFVDKSGREAHLSDFKGDFTLLFFGFTNCPDVCPLTLAMLAQVRADIAQRAPRFTPRVLFVSVDPGRDTPERIAAYLNGFDAEFAGVTAPDADLAPLLMQLGVAVEKQHDHSGGGNYNVVHNSAIYVLDPNAEWIAVSTGPHDPKVFASDYLRIRQRHAASGAATTGGIFWTISLSPETGTFVTQMPSRAARTCGVPHRKTQIDRATHGIQARRTASMATGAADAAAGLAASAGASFGIVVMGLAGFQILRKAARLAMDVMAAMMSTSQGVE